MKYTITLDSPDMSVLIDAAVSYGIRAQHEHAVSKRTWGAGSSHAITAGQHVKSVDRCIAALRLAAAEAAPDRAIPPVATGCNETLQVGDELEFVYGRPRPAASPLQPQRRKRSNVKRQVQVQKAGEVTT